MIRLLQAALAVTLVVVVMEIQTHPPFLLVVTRASLELQDSAVVACRHDPDSACPPLYASSRCELTSLAALEIPAGRIHTHTYYCAAFGPFAPYHASAHNEYVPRAMWDTFYRKSSVDTPTNHLLA